MAIQQLAVFVENTPGRLRAVTQVLAENKINMRAVSLSDTADFGVIRMITEDGERALGILKANQFAAKCADVVVVEMNDQPGALDELLGALEEKQINIEYMYAFKTGKENKALVILRVDRTEEANQLLGERGKQILTNEIEVMEALQ